MLQRSTLLFAALVVVLVAAAAQAATVARAPLDVLASRSDVIVYGVVRTVDDDLSTSKDGPFLTRLELDVTEAIRGVTRGPRFAFTLPGGRAGERVMVIPGLPRLAPGQEVVLLLERTSLGYIPTGLGQGVFVVERGAGDVVATQQLSGARYLVRGREGTLASSLPLDVLLRELERVAAAEVSR